ncbi:hypothetical protein [Kitasatospora sp. KL5]|uniref:hypothetical protein n=1 Tax=Kitasatospora sp. KL5 TaxID=3425125 RepID=UPI003D6E05B0
MVLSAVVYDAARLIGPDEPRRPPPAGLRGRRTALEAAEGRCAGLLLNGRIDRAAYQRRAADRARRGPHPE